MASVPYTVAQNEVKSLANPQSVASVGGDNGTAFYLFFREMPPGQQWVPPFTFGFMYTMDVPRPCQVDASQLPPWDTVMHTDSKLANIVAYDHPQKATMGIRA
jgi:hypothetical protein